ncbi:MAG: methyltransferase regulatory domain-containing protein [Burkholderiaceae bacterium]|nr:methyltransferase regulatory domain-containing protein [Burkholderiaceae bacterium]
MSWDQGYVVDAPYTYGYYPEMGLARAGYMLLAAGHGAIPPGPCCELGFGQGVSICVHAAADRSRQWWGNDFNPAHVRFAQSLASAAGVDAMLSDQSFEEFCARDDLPSFSFVALHGVWSWISRADQDLIVDFLERRLGVGGVLYISYNTLPGWAAMLPVRQLFAEYARSACSQAQGSVERMKEAVAFVEKLLATQPPFLRLNPIVNKRMEQLRTNAPEYLPHEYLNADWNLPTFADLARMLGSAGMSYVGPAVMTERIDVLHLDDAQRDFLAAIPDTMLRESTRDVLTHQQFRREYWVRGESRLSAGTQRERLSGQRLVLSALASQAPTSIIGARGESTLQAAVYQPLLAVLHDADGPFAWREILATMQTKHRLPAAQVAQALDLVIGLGLVHPLQDDALAQASTESCERLNARLLDPATMDGFSGVLASPLIGGGVRLSHMAQLFLHAARLGAQDPQELAAIAWRALQAQGQRVSVEGKVLQTPAENLEELTIRAREHVAQHAPLFRRMRIG